MATGFIKSSEGLPIAPFYKRIDNSDYYNNLVVLPPYYDKPQVPWVRGLVKRTEPNVPRLQDVVFTGPPLRVTYGGCKWNKICFNMDSEAEDFRMFLQQLSHFIYNVICANPSKYKTGAQNSNRFTWDEEIFLKTSSDPNIYSDELKCRLSTYRDHEASTENDSINYVDLVDTYLYRRDEQSDIALRVEPYEISAGTTIIPVFRLGYIRNNDRFSLTLTLLKGQIIPSSNPPVSKITNDQWELDTMDIV